MMMKIKRKEESYWLTDKYIVTSPEHIYKLVYQQIMTTTIVTGSGTFVNDEYNRVYDEDENDDEDAADANNDNNELKDYS